MTSFAIRIVVLIAYTLGNLALILVDGSQNYMLYTIMRSISQMALPLVCFLVVEGFYRTSNRRKYFFTFVFFGCISEVPFMFMSMEGLKIVESAIHTYLGADAPFNAQSLKQLRELVGLEEFAYYYDIYVNKSTAVINGMLTIAVNLLMLFLIDKIKEKYFGKKMFPYVALTSLTMIGTIIVLNLVFFEEPILITLLVSMFYFLRGNKPAISVMMLLAVVTFYIDISLLYAIGAIVSVLLIYTYKGKEGTKKYKYWFYIYYPAHMAVIYMVTKLL
ncbi:MAG: hypothetical protein IJZ25_02310 [Lachnospiraceae bacterium]|nr:hypothetical protein [Lachnospiraceae bacterium]